jgi:hypothetical protein
MQLYKQITEASRQKLTNSKFKIVPLIPFGKSSLSDTRGHFFSSVTES